MSLWESGDSTGEVSFGRLLNGAGSVAGRSEMSLTEVVDLVCRGGWPWLLDTAVPDAQSGLRDYLGEIARTEIPRSGGPAHDPVGVGRLLVSLARNEATNATYKTLADDVSGGADAPIHPRTVRRYLEALSRLFVVEGLPAWAPHLRSASQLRRAEKRYFVDPSLAVAALRTNAGRLRADLGCLGLLFESLAMRDLRVYAQANGARVFYFRDNTTLEVDAVIERADGEWMAAEIKLGGETLIRRGVKNLLRLRARIDEARMGAPTALVVITAAGYGFQHPDDVAIVPVGTLGP